MSRASFSHYLDADYANLEKIRKAHGKNSEEYRAANAEINQKAATNVGLNFATKVGGHYIGGGLWKFLFGG